MTRSKDVERVMRKVIKAAGKRLPFKSEKSTNALLEHAAGDMAEAYRIGAEEAQSEIIRRLLTLNVERPASVTGDTGGKPDAAV